MANIKIDPNVGTTDFDVVAGPYSGELGPALLGGSQAETKYVKTTDDLAALVAAASDGDQFILQYGSHNLSGPVVITKNRITIRGPAGAVLVTPNATVPAIRIDASAASVSCVDLWGFSISVRVGDTHGVEITGTNAVSDVRLFNLHVTKAAAGPAVSHGVVVNCEGSGFSLSDLLVSQCEISGPFDRAVGAFTPLEVIDYQSSPPGAPAVGDEYIVQPVGAGAWLGHDNEIATWSGAVWNFTLPAGYLNKRVVVVNDRNARMWDGANWNVSRATISDSEISGCFLTATAPDSMVRFLGCVNAQRLIVRACIINGSAATGIRFDCTGETVSIYGNQVVGTPSGVMGYDIDSFLVSDNILKGTASTSGVGVEVNAAADEYVVIGNRIETYQYGVSSFGGINRTVISKNNINDVQYGIWLPASGGLGTGGTVCSNVVVASGANSKTGIYVNELFDSVIDGNTVKDFNDDTGGDAAGIRVKGNSFIVSNNYIENCYRGLKADGSSGTVRILGNAVDGGDIGLDVVATINTGVLSVVGNSFRDQDQYHVKVQLNGGGSVVVNGNECRDKTDVDANPGILVDGQATGFTHGSVSGNTVRAYRGTSCAIKLNNCEAFTVADNAVYDGDGDGIRLEDVDESNISGNNVKGCLQVGKFGMVEDANCDQNLIDGNHLRGNTASTSFSGTNRTEGLNKV